jgi:hypothetical protein
VAELRELAGGRADLLAEVAGILEGATEGQLSLDAGEAIRAMIRLTMRYVDITSQVASQVRLERAAAKNPKAPPLTMGPDTIDRP